MTKYEKVIKERIEAGDLPLGYDVYNRRDINGLCPTITATSFLCPGRAGHTLIFERSDK